MSSRVLAAAAALGCLLPALPARALPAPRKIVDYDIHASLDDGRRELTGRETLRWTNPSDVPVSELKLHLYWNAFRNNRSTFFRESGGKLRSDQADEEEGFGSIDLTSMTLGGVDLLRSARFESPDDGNRDDRTVLSVPLGAPVAPGESVALEIAWKSRIPKVFARAGYVRDFYMIGQWYPKVAVFEPRGRRRRSGPGWNAHQYHANSEFYADWGDYRVALTVPERYVVASAGALVKETRAGGRKTLVYEQASIHDFAWSADPRFVVKEDFFDPAKDLPADELARAARLLGRSEADLRAGFRPVKLRYYMQPDHLGQWTRYADAQKWALVWFGLYAFPYPYAQSSCVDPPEDGSGAMGMEYQTIFTAGTMRAFGSWPLNGLREPEMIVVHEFGHGWWYGLVASNEFEESWMDEGINSFTEYEMLDRRYGGLARFPLGVRFGSFDLGRIQTIQAREVDRLVTPSWSFAPGAYGRNSYARAATSIDQIRRVLGEEAFWRAFRAWAERWRFDHPATEDFLDAFRPAAGGKLEPLYRETWYGHGTTDYAVTRLSSTEARAFAGYDDEGKRFDAPKKGPGGKSKTAKKETMAKKQYDSTALVSRTGTIPLPVAVVLTFENGVTWKTTWDGRSPWLRLRTTYSSRLAKAEVDPERKIVLDANPWNNARRAGEKQGPSAAAKVRAYALHGVQILLSSLWLLR
ncbi:MAG: M1 family metallopeptidase [Holophagales bacterium]|nr:M1 family metallopeptidase [Holophagales bacterium]